MGKIHREVLKHEKKLHVIGEDSERRAIDINEAENIAGALEDTLRRDTHCGPSLLIVRISVVKCASVR
jgi:hypothetical protein